MKSPLLTHASLPTLTLSLLSSFPTSLSCKIIFWFSCLKTLTTLALPSVCFLHLLCHHTLSSLNGSRLHSCCCSSFQTSHLLSPVPSRCLGIDTSPLESLALSSSRYVCLKQFFVHGILLLNILLQFPIVHQIKA